MDTENKFKNLKQRTVQSTILVAIFVYFVFELSSFYGQVSIEMRNELQKPTNNFSISMCMGIYSIPFSIGVRNCASLNKNLSNVFSWLKQSGLPEYIVVQVFQQNERSYKTKNNSSLQVRKTISSNE